MTDTTTDVRSVPKLPFARSDVASPHTANSARPSRARRDADR